MNKKYNPCDDCLAECLTCEYNLDLIEKTNIIQKLQQENKQQKETLREFKEALIHANNSENATNKKIRHECAYKNAWEELINPYKELYKQCKTEKEFIILGMSGVSGLLERAEEIMKKHGIKENE